MNKPMFNTALGALDLTQQSKPPMSFQGVSSRVFPLKANMARLTALCDSYLNLAPHVVWFRPALPYVYLMAIDYGKMAAEFENLGWVAQREIAFAVPLECYWIVNGRPEFAGWATVCPYIFVDNEMSLSTGREVYGWPKIKVWLAPKVNPWISNPVGSAELLTVSTMVFPELYAGKRQQPAVILRIRQETAAQMYRFPPDLRSPSGPLRFFARAVAGYADLVSQFAEFFTALPILGYEPAPLPPAWFNLMLRGSSYLNLMAAPPALNNITLKQFRDAERPSHICYQAIVRSEMRVTRFNAGGILGDANLLAGDPSGGFEILVRRYAAQPIVDSLGIEVSRSDFDEQGTDAVRPVFPFWLDFDLEYGIGEALCWRSRKSCWSGRSPLRETPEVDDHRFNTTCGVGAQDITGPFEFPNTTLRVLPLLARKERLEELCKQYLNEGLGEHRLYDFKPWGPYVYLVVTTFGEMSSKTNNVGWWAERELTFFIPVYVYRRGPHRKTGEILSVALVPAFGFADTETAAVVGREVNGRPLVTASITSPASTWLGDSGPTGENQKLLTLQTLLLPALHLGQEAQWRTLLEITQLDPLPYNDDVRWRMIAAGWIRELQGELRRKYEAAEEKPSELKNARALALEILANRQPIQTVSLKQFRDVGAPERACYQSLVRCGRTIEHIYDIREIEQRIHVHIRQDPALAIADILGLQAKWTETTGDGAVDIFQPVRPFWMRLAISEELGENLCWRVEEGWWQDDGRVPLYFEMEDATGVGLYPLGPQGLREQVLDWRSVKPAPDRLSRADAKEAIKEIDPQMVIEGILGREWENWGNPRWFQNQPPKPDFCIPCHSIGHNETREAAFGTNDASAWYPKSGQDWLQQLGEYERAFGEWLLFEKGQSEIACPSGSTESGHESQ